MVEESIKDSDRKSDFTTVSQPHLGLPNNPVLFPVRSSQESQPSGGWTSSKTHLQGTISLANRDLVLKFLVVHFFFKQIISMISNYWLLAENNFLPTQTNQIKENKWFNPVQEKKKKSHWNVPQREEAIIIPDL